MENEELIHDIEIRVSKEDLPIHNVSEIRNLARAFKNECERRPYPHWDAPEGLDDLSDRQVTEALLRASRIMGHYRSIKDKIKPVLDHVKKMIAAHQIYLQVNEFDQYSKTERRDMVLICPEYLEAEEVSFMLNRVAGIAEGEWGRWLESYKALSRSVELRKNKAVPGKSPTSGVKTPGRSDNPRGITKTAYKSRGSS